VKGYGLTTFGQLNAEDYDVLHDPGTTADCVEALAALAHGGKVLELGIGTGRVALPLAARGLTVHGIDASPEMIAKLREKPGGDAIVVSIGNFADVAVEGEFDLIALVFNTLFNLTSQEEQVRCFANVGRRLGKKGLFVVEAFVPDIVSLRDGLRTAALDFNSVTLEASLHDPVTQVVHYQYIRMTPQGVRLTPLPMRYAWPSELDLMARLAGLKLRERWGSWARDMFTAASRQHVSIYERA
jgi:SAM-dependent methyltransferase